MPNLTLFENALLALCAVLTVVLLAIMWWRMAGERVKAIWCGWLALPLLWKIVLPVVFGAFVLHGSGKSDGVGECGSEGEIFSRVERVDRVECGGEGEVVGDSCSGRKEGENSTLHLQLKTTTSQIVERVEIEDWYRHGAWKYKDAKIVFEHGFLFPFGTNHLSSAVVVSQGRIRSTYFDTEGIVSLGAKVAMFSGESRFAYEYKSSLVPGRDSYSFIWENVFVNRMRSQPMNARIELFRNGDISITTNGVGRTIPRELPFAHDGFGQDAEWVSANFTNATEILSCGYAKWVDEQVGIGLTNGLYKLTVTVPETPLETTQLKVGDYSVAVTNAGEYVFLLEKGVEYSFGTVPFLESVEYSFVDDIDSLEGAEIRSIKARNLDTTQGVWTIDGGVDISYPVRGSYGKILWLPLLRGWPDVGHLGSAEFPKTFDAMLLDYCGDIERVSYEWHSGCDNVKISSPNDASTLVSVDSMPRWSELKLSVTAKIAGRELTSVLNGSYGFNQYPGVYCSIAMQNELILRGRWMEGSKSAIATVGMEADIPTNGSLRVSLAQGADKVETDMPLPKEFRIFVGNSFKTEIAIDGINTSSVKGDVVLKCEFIDANGNVGNSCNMPITVVDPLEVLIPSTPASGVCVLKDSSVNVSLKIAPDFYFTPVVEWYTAQRCYNKEYDTWARKADGGLDTSLLMEKPGVFALKARLICGVQSNETVYVHKESEPYCAAIKERLGPVEKGEFNHIGVARSVGLLRLRNTALGHLGLAEYGKDMVLPSMNGFSRVSKDKWKCNRFVADIAIEAGFQVQHNESSHWLGGTYPPLANDWARGWRIGDWEHLDTVYPEPGFLAARHNANGPGHCGIVDYDGWVISARPDGVGRNAKRMLDGTVKYNIPKE